MADMSEADRERFLQGTRVAVIGITRSERAPLLAPVWYEYDSADACFRVVISSTSAKARLLSRTGRATICVQEDGERYGYVAAEGPVACRPLSQSECREVMLSMALRYLGPNDGTRFADEFAEPDVQLVTLTPQSWQAEDLRSVVD
jgi:nitroimidazol reductase NimA-like FMN-containing flavoprotein (pyridoxamine 5'-phosphate oxidase superfamily)